MDCEKAVPYSRCVSVNIRIDIENGPHRKIALHWQNTGDEQLHVLWANIILDIPANNKNF